MKFSIYILQLSKWQLVYLGFFTFLVLEVFALIFYKQRIFFSDCAFHMFYILKDGEFLFELNRIGGFFTQLAPWMGGKMQLSLKAISMLYSSSFVFYQAIIFFFIAVGLNEKKFAICLLLFNVLIVGDVFYWPISELPLGTAFTFLFLAIHKYLLNHQNRRAIHVYFVVGSLVLYFFHPMVLFVMLFYLLYQCLGSIKNEDKRMWLLYCFTFTIGFVLKSILTKSGPESESIKSLGNFITYFPNYLNIPANRNFLAFLIKDYYLLPILIASISILYIRNKEYKKLIFVFISLVGYLLLVNISFAHGPVQFYIENLYLPLSIFVIIPIVFDLLPKLKRPQLIFLLLAILVIRCGHIYCSNSKFSDKLTFQKEIIEEAKERYNGKLLIKETPKMREKLVMTWGSSYEFWLLSTVESDTTISIVVDQNIEEILWGKEENKKFLTKWGSIEYAEFPKKYFNLYNDTSVYSYLEEYPNH